MEKMILLKINFIFSFTNKLGTAIMRKMETMTATIRKTKVAKSLSLCQSFLGGHGLTRETEADSRNESASFIWLRQHRSKSPPAC